jgi:predicted nucleotide-binding protein (sugar kinase/HSP70/actin superfamily)
MKRSPASNLKIQENHPLSGRKLWIPRMSTGAAKAMAAAFRSLDIEADVSPQSDAGTLALAAKVTTGEECLPQRVVLGNFMKVILSPGFNPSKTAFLLPTSSGPCRFGQYAPFLKKLLREWGYPDALVFSPTSSNQYEGIAADVNTFMRTGWRALLASDILRKCLLMFRPYESEKGSADRIHDEGLEEICTVLSDSSLNLELQMKSLIQRLGRIRDRFNALRLKSPLRTRPLIGVVGEIFLRFNSFSNQQIIHRIEGAGGEVWISDITEWVWYTQWEVERKLRETGRRFSMEMMKAKIRHAVQHQDEKQLISVFNDLFRGREEMPVEQVLKFSEPYLPPQKALGEMTLNAGKTVAYFHAGCDGVVDISPFTCMNGIVTEAVYPVISRELNDFPTRIFYFDGVPLDLDMDLEIFMELVMAYRKKRIKAGFGAEMEPKDIKLVK